MNVVDVLLAIVLGLAAVAGLRRGFIGGTVGLLAWIGAMALALALTLPVAGAFERLVPVPSSVVRAASFIALAVGLELLLGLIGRVIAGPLRAAVRSGRPFAAADSLLGVLPAVVLTGLVAGLIIVTLPLLPIGSEAREELQGSRIAPVLVAPLSAVQPLLGRIVGEGDDAPLVVTRLSADGREALDLPADLALAEDPESEERLVALANEERVRAGLRPLEVDPRLVAVARAHSTEMFRRRYFAHTSPTTGTPFDRLDAAGIRYLRAGENLAYARSAALAHRGLMESPGHRANILRPEFTHIGVGAISAGPHGRMMTQLFLTGR